MDRQDAIERYKVALGHRITLARTVYGGMEQAELARAIGVRPESVSRWENGKTLPTVIDIFALAEALDLPPSELLDPESEPPVLKRRWDELVSAMGHLPDADQVRMVKKLGRVVRPTALLSRKRGR